MARDKGNKGLLIKALCGLGGVYNLIGRYKDAMQAYGKVEMLVSDRRSIIEALIGQAATHENLAEYDSMLEVLNRLIKLCRDTTNEVYTLSRYCWVYRLQGRIAKSIEAGNRGMKLLKTLKKREISQKELYFAEGAIVNAMGGIYWSQGDFDKAIELHQRFLIVSEESGNLYGVGMALNNMGSVYVHKGEYDKALPMFERKLAISEMLGNKIGMAMAANNLGIIYNHYKSFGKAIELYEQALSIAEELNDTLGVLHVTINLGSIYKDNADYDRAFAFFQKAMAIATKLGDKQAIGAIYMDLGEIHKELNDLDKAREYLEKAQAIFKALVNKIFLSATMQVIIEVGIKEIEKYGVSKTRERIQKAYAQVDEKSKLASDMNSEMDRAVALFLQARVASLDEKWDKKNVKEKFIESIKMFEEHKIVDELGKAYYFYALYLRKIGESETARAFLAKAKKIFKEFGNVHYLGKIDKVKGTRTASRGS